MSYRQLLKQVDAFANGLYEVPFKTPAILVIWAKDTAETFVAQLGAVKAGLNVSETKQSSDSFLTFLDQVIYLDETAEEKDVVKALKSGARWLVVSPTIRPQVRLFRLLSHFSILRNATHSMTCFGTPA